MLAFQLLGPVALFDNSQPVTHFRSQKEIALLIYLAYTGQTHTRDFIADLLWDGRDNKQARSNLRTVLVRLRKQVGDAIDASRQTLALAPACLQQVDAVDLLARLAAISRVDTAADADALQSALDAYQSEFLTDFVLTDAPEFEQWMIRTREEIHRQVIAAYEKLGHYTLENSATTDGIAVAQRWLAVDALDEAAHTLLIRHLLADGQTRAARVHYEHCVELLEQELGVAPPAEMTALIEAARPTPPPPASPSTTPLIPTANHGSVAEHRQLAESRPQADHRAPPTDRPAVPPPPARVLHNLPAPHDQFFGRVAAQQDIAERLGQPWCRLVTIIGQGGVGKTRLATTVARSRRDAYRDGAWLVALADIDAEDDDPAEAIAVEIATALDLRLAGASTPVEQLLDHLQHKHLLLVLDNFEQLLDGGAPLVAELLERCDQVQMIVTSREPLRMRAEWTIALTGLGYAPAEQPGDSTVGDGDERGDAFDLFVARRAQHRRDPLPPHDYPTVHQICRLVGGLPLALELAAALTPRKALQTIVAELQAGFDALATSLRDVPQRHRSLQIVFAMSWRTLSPALQNRLARLSIFRGGFTAAAAQQIAAADGDDLIALGEKSLLAYDPAAERYTLHPVVRAYAAAELAETEQALQQHGCYYLKRLAQHRAMLEHDTPQHAVAALDPDLENVRLAWQTGLSSPELVEGGAMAGASTSSATVLLLDALPALSIVYQLRGLAHEAEATMQSTLRAAEKWGADGLVLATRAGLERARFQNRLGRCRAALETVKVALRHAHQCGDRWAEGMGHVLWGESLWRLGEYTEAQQKLNHALTVAHAIGGGWESTLLIGWCHHHLGVIDDIQGRYDDAIGHLEKASAAWREIDNMQALSGSVNSIGLVYLHQGDLLQAQKAMETALALCKRLNDYHRQSSLVTNLSIIATELGDYLSAHHYLQLGAEIATTTGDLTAQGLVYTTLGKNYRLLGKPELAEKSLEEGLQISESIGNRTLMATGLFYLAEARREQGEQKQTKALYEQALEIAHQDDLRYLTCEVLIGLAEFLSRDNEGEAKQYSIQAIQLAKTLQNPDFLERATSVNHFLSVT